jgi:hypothetical protein
VIYLSGSVNPNLPPEVGVMLTPMMGNKLPEDRAWSADTGCFLQPDKHDDDRYLAWLESRLHAVDRCLFATAPDVVGDALATIKCSVPMLSRIRAIGYPSALVAQDGLEDLPVPWDEFDALFVGGTTTWKLSEAAYALAREAKRRGKWTHMGRVNSERRLRAAFTGGYDSADGTYIAFGPDVLMPRLERWVTRLALQPVLTGMDQ